MHPFLLSVFIFCIYFELIFKMKSVDNTSANPRISIAGNAVPKKIVPTITIVRKPTITIISRCASILHGLKNTASSIPMIRPFGEMYNAWIFPALPPERYLHSFSDCFCAAYSLAHILYMPDISVILGDRTIR